MFLKLLFWSSSSSTRRTKQVWRRLAPLMHWKQNGFLDVWLCYSYDWSPTCAKVSAINCMLISFIFVPVWVFVFMFRLFSHAPPPPYPNPDDSSNCLYNSHLPVLLPCQSPEMTLCGWRGYSIYMPSMNPCHPCIVRSIFRNCCAVLSLLTPPGTCLKDLFIVGL